VLRTIADVFLHLDRHLAEFVQAHGSSTYGLLFAIIFMETGVVVTPFLPGDSLLFACGALAASGALKLPVLFGLLMSAAILGDNTNYWIGRISGERIFTREESLLFKPKHLQRAADFYARHGAKTVVLARFMPIVRTFAPLVAGAARMSYRTFLTFSVIGGLAWIWSMLLIGYFLGSRFPGVSEHLELVIIVVVLLSISPGIVSWLRARRAARAVGSGNAAR